MAASWLPIPRRSVLEAAIHTPRNADVQKLLAPGWPPFPPYSRPDAATRPHFAGHGHAHYRPPRPGICQARQALPRRHQDHLQDHQPGHHLHRHRHRRVGGGARQHALARRPRADGRDRPVCDAVEDHGRETRAAPRIHHDGLAHRRRPGCGRGPPAPGQEQGDQGGLRAAQRDLDRLPVADRGDRSPRPTIATTNGGSTSPSAARRRG